MALLERGAFAAPDSAQRNGTLGLTVMNEISSPAINAAEVQKVITHRLLIGDNQSVVPYLIQSSETFDVAYLDPPYNGYVMKNGAYVPEIDDELWLSRLRNLIQKVHTLLSDDGLLFLSINDREAAYCRVICDEVFGKQNFMAQIVRRRTNRPLHAHVFSREHEYILTFAKNAERIHASWDRPPVSTWWDFAGTDEDAAQEIRAQFGNLVFDHAKPSALIGNCIAICQKKDAKVLDVYAGSGTTAQAVETLNRADSGTRSFTLIQRKECYHGCDISEICERRIQKIISGSFLAQKCIIYQAHVPNDINTQ